MPWDTETCEMAAVTGNIECLEYAHNNGCPWDSATILERALRGGDACIKYVCCNGCDITDTAILKTRRDEVRMYLYTVLEERNK